MNRMATRHPKQLLGMGVNQPFKKLDQDLDGQIAGVTRTIDGLSHAQLWMGSRHGCQLSGCTQRTIALARKLRTRIMAEMPNLERLSGAPPPCCTWLWLG